MIYTHDCTHLYLQPEWNSAIQDGVHHGLLPYLQSLRSSLPLFKLIDQDQDLPALVSLADHIQDHFTDVIILGTGGSSLGGQALCDLRAHDLPRLHFHDNIDPFTFKRLFNFINPTRTAVIAISKSGNTAETLMQLLVCLQHWLTILPQDQLKNHFWIIAENCENGIREVAHYYHLPCLDHPSDIGGRFAAFTLVGLLPALIAGLDALAIRKGARQVLDVLQDAQQPTDSPPVEGALVNFGLISAGFTQSVLFPYIDRLSIFALWYRQLWAESLGKNGLGTTPIRAIGTIDQHSQLQ
ncbi:MAG TPA: glucose-6-phosphate isomerase, partial [Candidatus Nitrosotenuis sp.]|nr:glucose-6-phosphate isomerase [Candidatus Nitrosotenuis sp.]